ncbi:MAG: PQQ-binding-like beta-propeller repeat protein [Methanosarcinales archaeon]|uniref:PQQ-binding-like beta-propeller repeat protein n=1 Tax=Candidatus Ethanoperedens thermophilum TaxID=2766897 RepID=A0A848D6F9_9EURY|nr:PQQ-binding-like beta-propeller repeat protein [Candidatus Ethanoperedens thermophilum]
MKMVRYNDCNCIFRIAVGTIVLILVLFIEGTVTAVAADTEIVYDDGDAENFLSTGDGYVIKMSSPFYKPFTITTVKIFGYRYGDDSWINLDIWDQDKNTIYHYTAMQSDYFTFDKSWANINVENVVVDGDFYVFFSTDSHNPNDLNTTGVEVGEDYSLPSEDRSYIADFSNSVGFYNSLEPSIHGGNWMIRAAVHEGGSIVETDDNNIIVKNDDTSELYGVSDWPMFQHDAAHTGATDDVVLPPLEMVWVSDTGGSGSGSPSIVADTVFTHDSHGGVYAVDAKTGVTKWKYATGEIIYDSSPTVSENTVYIGTEEHLYAIDATNGYFKWKYKTGHNVGMATVVDGNVYFGARSDLYSIDATTGKDQWKLEGKVGGNEFGPAVVGGVVYMIGFMRSETISDTIIAINAATGAEIWSCDLEDEASSTPTVVDGIVYIGGNDYLYAFDTSNGKEKWKYQVGGVIESSPAVSRGTIYFGSEDHFVYAVDTATGKEKWRFKTDGSIQSSPAVSENVLYVCSGVSIDESAIYAFDTATGTLKWKQIINFQTHSAPAIANGMLYIGVDPNGYNAGVLAFAHSDTAPAFEEVAAIVSQSSTSIIDSILGETESQESSLTSDQTSTSLKNSMNWIFLLAVLVVVGAVLFIALKRKGVKEVATAPITSSGSVDIKRGYEILPNRDLRVGIRVTNNTGYSVMNAESILEYPESLFSIKDNILHNLGNIDNGGTRTATYILKPMACIHQEKISALITYRDHLGNKQTTRMRPKELHCVFPFLKGIDTTPDEYIRFTESGYHREDGISFDGVSIDDMIRIIDTTCAQRLKQIGEATTVDGGKIIYLAGESLGEKATYLLTALVQEYHGLTQIILRAHSDNKPGLVGFLSEITDSIRHLTTSIQSAKEIGVIEKTRVINIIDSVVQRTYFGDVGGADVNIKDSVVTRSKIGDDKSGL